MKKYPIHKAALAFPKLTPDERAELKASLEKNGQTHPIILVNGEIADGRSRYELCQELGVEPFFITRNGQTDAVSVAKSQMEGRKYDKETRAMIGAKLKPLFAEEIAKKEKARKKGEPATNPNLGESRGEASDLAAALVGLSHGTIDNATKVVEQGTPELIEAVETKQVSVSAAAEVAALPKSEQKKIVEAGPKAIKEKAKKIRHAKKAKKGAAGDTWVELADKIYQLTSSIEHWGGIKVVANDRGWSKKNKIGFVQQLRETIATFEQFISTIEGDMK